MCRLSKYRFFRVASESAPISIWFPRYLLMDSSTSFLFGGPQFLGPPFFVSDRNRLRNVDNLTKLALSLSFPEVQPRAPAVYNTIENPSVIFCGERWKRREPNPRSANRIGHSESDR